MILLIYMQPRKSLKVINLLQILSLATALLFAGCGKSTIDKVTANLTVLAFGDSLTKGYGVKDDESYPSILGRLLGCKMVNAGVSGEVTSDGLKRLPNELEAHNPDLVILCFGGNDMLQKKSMEEMKLNLESMVDLIKAKGCDLILIGVPRPSLGLKVPSVYKDLADKYDLPYDGTTLRTILSAASLTSDDFIHPNAKGYEQMAKSFLSLIRESEK
jgi:acyl-CoA thioesterase I